MTLTHILVFTAAALLYVFLLPKSWRGWALFVGSVLAIYWLQPPLRVRRADFLFPTATLALVALTWAATRAPNQAWAREDTAAAMTMAALVLALSLGRYLAPSARLTPSAPPPTLTVAAWIAGAGVALALAAGRAGGGRRASLALTVGIVALFVLLKTEPLAEALSRALRRWQGQPTSLARADELEWLGFSYVAFRLLHTLRDRQTGQLPPLSLREYVTYAVFFPAVTAGPIDRAERFLQDLRTLDGPHVAQIVQGGGRIAVGVAKKFIVADALAYMALNATRAEQARSAWGLWVLLYAYTLQIYFDFSGYSDIAIGIGQLVGVKLPENFAQPYLQRNITQFWQSWHITLSNWVRFYVFSPLSRALLKRKPRPSPTALAFVGQMATMLVIGLWHGVTWHFVAWGAWHGVGLFAHKVWSDKTRRLYMRLRARPRAGRALGALGTLLTFHFVALGWVWFALPDVGTGWRVLLRLFGG